MKNLIYIFLTALLINSCGTDNSTSEKERELRAKELELRERELALQESKNATNNGNNSQSVSPPPEKTEKELKRELAIKECESPTKYLKMTDVSLKGTFKNALSAKFDGFKVRFNIQNNATLVTFKNVKCRVTLTSNSGSNILVKNFTVNEFVQAGRSITYNGEFECTNQQFKDTDNYAITILDSECN